ncbi:MAG: hypothetical protein DYH15_12135 [Nitrosomonas sp. PRO4]|nr:hypothetical protein [Nitrosomonas sp. PRO4]
MITKEQWQEIEKTLSFPYAIVKLQCDGHDVSAVVEIHKSRLVIDVYVDGFVKGEWFNDESEIGNKFYPRVTKYLLKPLERKEALKNACNKRLGKDLRDYFRKEYDKKFSYLVPHFTNAKSFCRHIRKTCQSVEFIE